MTIFAAPDQLRANRILRLNAVITFLGFLDTHLLIPVVALYAAELGASPALAGLAIGVYSIANTPANVIFGRLIDRVGQRGPLIVGLVLDAVSMYLYSSVRLPFQLILVRILHGASGGLVAPATMSIAARYSPQGRKGRAMSVYGMMLALTTLVGYGVSGVVTSRWGFNTLFFLGAGLLAAGAVLSLRLPGKTEKPAELPLSERAAARSLLVRPPLVLAYLSIFAQYFAFGGVVTLLPLYLRAWGMGFLQVGMLLAIFSIVFIITQFPGGALSDRSRRLKPVVAGLGLGLVSLLVLPLSPRFPLMATAMAVYGAAYGLIFPAISAMVADNTKPHEHGLGTGLFHAFLTAGVALGAPVIGVAGDLAGVETGLRLSTALMVPALALAVIMLRRE